MFACRHFLALFIALVWTRWATPCVAVHARSKRWPSWLKILWSSAPDTVQFDDKKLRPATPVKRLADTKAALVSSDVFQKKAAASCHGIAEDQAAGCMQVATDRLFCAMFARHAGQFDGYEGVAQEKIHCKEVDPMETVQDATKDAIEQREAQEG